MTIDEANTALAVAGTRRERLVAALALAAAAQAEADRLRSVLGTPGTDWLCVPCRQAWPHGTEPADGNCPVCSRPLKAEP